MGFIALHCIVPSSCRLRLHPVKHALHGQVLGHGHSLWSTGACCSETSIAAAFTVLGTSIAAAMITSYTKAECQAVKQHVCASSATVRASVAAAAMSLQG